MAMAISMAASCSSSSSYLLIKRLEGGPRLSRQSLGGAFHLLLARRSLRSSSLPYSSSSSSVRRRPFVSASASAEQSSDGTNSPPLNGKHGFEYDLVTIGAGSGGVRASRFAANFGAKVAICELPFATISSDTTGGVGGTCVLRGCVPKKLLVFGSKFSHDFEECKGFGWSFDIEPKHDWSTLIAQKNAEIRRLTGVYKNVLANSNVGLIEGRGKIVDPHTVEINGKHYTTNHILVAVGGRAVVLDIPGKEFAITSDEALDLPSRPDKISIIGGGYIALEFASIFNGLGTEVHVYIRQKKVLRGFDEEIRDFIADQMALRGVNFHFEESPLAIEKAANGLFSLKTTKGTEHSFSHVMFGTGRAPNTKNLGLEEVGVKLNAKGAIEVDQYSKTNIDSIWAVGDVTDRVNLTPVAIMEGGAFARNVFGGQDVKSDHGNIPCAVFTQPPIGSVGLTEEQAIEQYGDIDVFTANFRPMKATLSGLPDRTFMKLIVDATSDRVVGAHMCGEDAAEILQGVAIAVKAGLTKSDFDNTVGIHPTAAEELVTMRTPTRVLRHKSKQTADVEGGQVVTSL